MRHFLTILICLGLVATVDAATYNLTAGEAGDVAQVQTAINTLGHKDNLVFPAGTFNWGSSGHLVITKAITIRGASQSTTIINSSYPLNTSPKGLFAWTISVDPKSDADPYTWGINNLTINNTVNGTFTFSITGGTSGTPGAALRGISRNFRMHHVTINCTGFDMFQVTDVVGLMDHNTWVAGCDASTPPKCAQIFNIYHPSWPNSDNTTADWGHGSYQNPVPWGTGSDNFLVIEDCEITTTTKAITDSWEGGRFIVRHCTTNGTFGVSNHGTESHGGSRGCRAVEEYNNWHRGLPTSPPETRSGTFIGFNNIVEGVSGAAAFKRLQNHRSTLIKDLGGCFGTNLPTPTFLGAVNFSGLGSYASHVTVDQNTPLANPAGTPSAGNEPITGNDAPILYSGTAQTAIVVNNGGTFTVTGSPGWSASTGGPLNKGTWKTLDNPSLVYVESAGFDYVVTNTSVPPGDGNQPTSSTGAGPALIDSNGTNTLTVSSNIGNASSKSFFINAGQTFNIKAVYNPLDAPGRGVSDKNAVQVLTGWPHQQWDPNYEWNNWTGPAIYGGTKTSWRVTQGIYKEGRDFFRNTPKLGYPHITSPTTAQRWIGTDTNHSSTLLLDTDVYGAPYPDVLTGAATGKIIQLTGDLAFGNAIIGDPPLVRTVTVTNLGDATLTVSSVAYTPSVFSGPTDSFAVLPGATFNVDVEFDPVAAIHYSGSVTFNSDATGGTNIILASGDGVLGESGDIERPYKVFRIIKRVLSKWMP